MVDEVINEMRRKTESSITATAEHMATVRTGTASAALLNSVTVNAYGSQMRIQELATVSAPEPRLLIVSPWDRTQLAAVERAIQAANLGLNPQSDGSLLRVPIPPLTEERRKEIVKAVRRMVEEGKVAVRNLRRDANDHLKRAQKNHEISEDDEKRAQEKIQKITDEAIERLDHMGKAKEEEVMQV
jgi:ribosome recycling factor